MSTQSPLRAPFTRGALLALLPFLLAVSQAFPAPIVYQAVGPGPTELLEVDLGAMTGTKLLTFSYASRVHALAHCPAPPSRSASLDPTCPRPREDRLLAVGRDNGEVISVKLADLTETLLGLLPVELDGGVVQLACDTDGVAYLTSQDSEDLYRMDPEACDGVTCPVSHVAKVETSTGAGDVDVDGADVTIGPEGYLYLLTNGHRVDRALFRVDKGTGHAFRVGSVATPENSNGLGMLEDGRFVVACNDDKLYELDPVTAAVTPLGSLTLGGDPLKIRDGDLATIPVVSEWVPICRPARFWKTHGGDFGGRPNITHAVLAAAGGSLEVCGQTLVHGGAVGSLESPLEALCVEVEGIGRRALYRQLTAAALNCVVSGVGDCGLLVPDFDTCNTQCADGTGKLGVWECNRRLDCFNRGGVYDWIERTCEIDEVGCHLRPLCDSPHPSLCFDPEGPASGWRDCRDARLNSCTLDGC